MIRINIVYHRSNTAGLHSSDDGDGSSQSFSLVITLISI
jgi:hypothetical protein